MVISGCNSFRIKPKVALIIPAPIRTTSLFERMVVSDIIVFFYKVQRYFNIITIKRLIHLQKVTFITKQYGFDK
ncbi:hypothetical protein FFL01_22020 [Flavobacterium flevense]|uniref:Uncharacterized protein n=1 Tax=Flavobacterium flevense TaxID=983 RepID=A0A4Y4B1V2_9FLAO|nr:hypothetical protein FFL01_22020 [Flavobacterium flevense]